MRIRWGEWPAKAAVDKYASEPTRFHHMNLVELLVSWLHSSTIMTMHRSRPIRSRHVVVVVLIFLGIVYFLSVYGERTLRLEHASLDIRNKTLGVGLYLTRVKSGS